MITIITCPFRPGGFLSHVWLEDGQIWWPEAPDCTARNQPLYSYQSLGHPWGHGACWTFLGSVEGKILSGNHWFFVFPCFDPKNIGFVNVLLNQSDSNISPKMPHGFFSKLGASWNHSLSHGWSWSSLSPWEMKRGPSLILRDTHTKLVIMWYVPSVSVINPKLHFSIPIHKSYSRHIPKYPVIFLSYFSIPIQNVQQTY